MTLYINNTEVKFTTFPNNETRLDLDPSILTDYNKVIWKYKTNSDIFELFQLDNVLQSYSEYDLYIPYLPYSRMDRVENVNTAFSLEIIVDLLSLISANNIYILDPHSEKSITLSGDVIKEFNYSLAKQVIKDNNIDLDKTIIVFPDKGASKRYNKNDYPNVVTLEKVRDFATGKITSIKVSDVDFTNQLENIEDIYIIDDLCSYGGTFVGGLKSLRDYGFTGKANLIVTHSEEALTKGSVLDEFDHVYTTNSILDSNPDKVTIYDFKEIFTGE